MGRRAEGRSFLPPCWPRPALALALCAAVGVMSMTSGCGVGGIETTGSATDSEGYLDILADRYDEIFPDDRVLTVRIVMSEADRAAMRADLVGKHYYRADIWIGDELVRDVAVRTKGTSSLMQAAFSPAMPPGLKVDFNFFNSQRHYHGIKKLCYGNGFTDPTVMKEFLGYELMAAMGIATPRACFVDLWLNEVHQGLFTQVEAVDASFVRENFENGGGNLYKPELAAGRLDWTEADAVAQRATSPVVGEASSSTTTTTRGSYKVGGGDLETIIERLGDDAGWIPGRLVSGRTGTSANTPGDAARDPGKPDRTDPMSLMNITRDYLVSAGLKTNEDRADHSRLYDLLEVLNGDPSVVATEDLESVLDVDQVLRFLAVSVVLVHLDNYIGMGHNYYLYDDGGKFSIIPWDLNMAFGGFECGLSEERLIGYLIDEPTALALDMYPLVEQLLTEPEYVEVYHAYLREFIEGPFSFERMDARIREIADVIRPYVVADGRLSIEQFDDGLDEHLAGNSPSWTMGGVFIGLRYFVEGRVASIEAQLSGEKRASYGDGTGNRGAMVIGGPGGFRPPGGPLDGPQPQQGTTSGAGETADGGSGG